MISALQKEHYCFTFQNHFVVHSVYHIIQIGENDLQILTSSSICGFTLWIKCLLWTQAYIPQTLADVSAEKAKPGRINPWYK